MDLKLAKQNWRKGEEERNSKAQGNTSEDPQIPLMVNHRYAGRLSKYLPQWKNISNNPLVLSWVEGVKFIFTQTPFQQGARLSSIKDSDIPLYRENIDELNNIAAIIKCTLQMVNLFHLISKEKTQIKNSDLF